jgi:hypothetical protein
MIRIANIHAAVSALMLTIAATGIDAQPVNKYKSNGSFAEFVATDTAGCRFLYLYVARGGTTSAPETFLYYDTYDACTDTWGFGSGTIPNGSFVTSKNTMSIRMTGTPPSSFYFEGERPNLALTLTRDGIFTQRSSGHVRIEYYNHVVQRHGTWTYFTATVSGTFAGSAMVGHEAITGTGKEHYMEFERGGE